MRRFLILISLLALLSCGEAVEETENQDNAGTEIIEQTVEVASYEECIAYCGLLLPDQQATPKQPIKQ